MRVAKTCLLAKKIVKMPKIVKRAKNDEYRLYSIQIEVLEVRLCVSMQTLIVRVLIWSDASSKDHVVGVAVMSPSTAHCHLHLDHRRRLASLAPQETR